MTGYERMMAALMRKEPDRVPTWELIVDPPVIKALYGDISYADFVEREDLDGITCVEDQKRKDLGSNIYGDEWGIIWKIEPSGLSYPVEGPIKSKRDLDKYRAPDPDAPWRLRTLEKYVKRFKGKKAIVFLGHETFEFSHYLMGGMDKLFMSYVLKPALVTRLSEMISEYKCKVLENAAKVGADALLTGDDYAGRKGSFMSPTHFRQFVQPYLQRAVNIAKQNNLPFIKHTDGNLKEIIDMIVDTGIDALDPIEPMAGMDIGQIKEKYGERICVIGNVDCTEVLPRGTKEDVEEAVKETIAKASGGGGHILASSNSIHPAVKPENYKTMIETARKHGVYPLDPEMVRRYKTHNYITKFGE
jgi:uroporphyrinogen decarboxylase